MENLKEKLLSLGVFLDNEYLDFYCTLIVNNKSTAIEKFKTQKHHIIPKTYYKLNSLNIDNSCDNIVNLLYSDHILAHYYLCLCVDSTNKSLAYRLQNSFLHLIKADANNKQKIEAFNVNDLPLYQEIYTNWKILNSKLQIGKPAWNKGLTKETDSRVAKYSKPRHFSKEHNEHNRQSLINYYKTHHGTMLGKHLSDEAKKKLSMARSIPIICLETGIIYFNSIEASKALGITRTAITNCLRGNSKTAGGFHWKYENEKEDK